MTRMTPFATLLLCALLLAGCSQSAALRTADRIAPQTASLPAQNESAAPPGLPPASLPPFPSGHLASALLAYQRVGADTFERSTGAPNEDTSLRLASPAGHISWGIWGFGVSAGARTCIVDLVTESGNEAYFAAANYARHAWDIAGPLPGPQQEFSLDSPDYISEEGDVFVAVITWDGSSALVEQLQLNFEVAPVQQTIDFSGGYTSMASINGRPAISYFDGAEHDLVFVRADNQFGEVWGGRKIVDSTGQTGKYSSLAQVDTFPAIAYYDETEKDLRYVRALDENGLEWGLPLTVDGLLTETGEYCSLKVVDGFPAISYYDVDGPGLRYVRALDATGLLWGTPEDVDNSGNAGQFTSLAIVDGFPAIGYRHGALGQLRYVRAVDDAGSEWGEPLILDELSNGGFYAGLVLVDGFPAICHYDGSDSRLRFMRASNAQGSAWGDAVTLDGADDDAGSYCSMAVIGELPMIVYHKGIEGDLRMVQALDASGDDWSAPIVLDDTSIIVGRDTSLLDVYGHPAVSYFDQTNEGLRYMWDF